MHQRPALQGAQGMGQKGTAQLGKTAEGGDNVVHEPIEESLKDYVPFRLQKPADSVYIGGKILGENRPQPTGHTGP